MSWAISRRRSPSTWTFWSIQVRRRATSSSVRSRTRVSGEISVAAQTILAVGFPMPKMYVRAISSRFSRGMSTPAIRAMPFLLALALLVPGVLADDHHHAVAADHLALLTDGFDARPDLHRHSYLYRYVIRPRVRS